MDINIEGKVINENSPAFIIAEIGANQNNNVEDIKKIIDKAKECGVDAVKFQTYTPQELLADKDRIITWGKSGQEKTQTIAQYPSPMDEMNLNIIKSLKAMYPECVIGFSDHSLGTTAAIGAVALGARVIEKHFTLDKNLEGPDHWFSMDPQDMSSLVKEIRNLESAMGSSRKRVLACEEKEKEVSTRSLVINRDIKKGEIVKAEDLQMLRPGWGISPFDKDKVIGMKVTKDMVKDSVLTWECFK